MSNHSDTIKYFGECTAYSAKGYFKSADFRRLWIYVLLFLNIIFSVFAMLDIFSDTAIKIMGAVSLCASTLLLFYQTREETDYISKSMKTGEEYLKLHNDIFIIFSQGKYSHQDVEDIKDRVNKLNGKKKSSISLVGKYWAKWAIRYSGEMRIWWK